MPDYSKVEIDINGGYRVVSGLIILIAEQPAVRAKLISALLNDAYQKGFDDCGKRIRDLIGAQPGEN